MPEVEQIFHESWSLMSYNIACMCLCFWRPSLRSLRNTLNKKEKESFEILGPQMRGVQTSQWLNYTDLRECDKFLLVFLIATKAWKHVIAHFKLQSFYILHLL